MEFQLTQEVSESLLKNGRTTIISNFSEELRNFFKTKNYGEGILSMFIGVICVAPEFDFFFKMRKPKYKRGKEIIIQNNAEIELESTLRFDLKLSFEKFLRANEFEARTMLALEVLNSLNVLNKLKIKDFNNESFVEDLRSYIVKQKIV